MRSCMLVFGVGLVAAASGASAAMAQASAPAVKALMAKLAADDAKERIEAAIDLAALGPSAVPAVPLLVTTLQDTRPMTSLVPMHSGLIGGHHTSPCMAAAFALGKIGDRRAVQPLCNLMLDTSPKNKGNWLERQEAALALGEIGDPSALKPLLTFATTNGYSMSLDEALLAAARLLRSYTVKDLAALGVPPVARSHPRFTRPWLDYSIAGNWTTDPKGRRCWVVFTPEAQLYVDFTTGQVVHTAPMPNRPPAAAEPPPE